MKRYLSFAKTADHWIISTLTAETGGRGILAYEQDPQWREKRKNISASRASRA